MTEEKVTCHTPTPGKQPVRIPRWKYDAVCTAILSVLGRGDVAFRDLTDAVRSELPPQTLDELGSLGWHVTTVKLDLEVREVIARLPKVTPQRLTLVRAPRAQ